MAPPLLTLKDIRLRVQAAPLFSGVELAIAVDDRISLVGRNGSGKTTLLKIIAGQIEADAGDRFQKPGARIAYLPQEPVFDGYETVGDYVAAGLAADAEHAFHRVEAALGEVGLAAETACTTLSGGEARKAAISRALVSEPDLLLLDEPTNHLDIATIQWLEDKLKTFPGALMIISHDRAFLKAISKTTFWLDRGLVRRMDRGFAHFDEWQAQVYADEEAAAQRFEKKLEEELHWLARGVTARRKRNQGRLKRLHDMRREKAEVIKRVGNVKLLADSGAVSGKTVIEAENISKVYGDRSLFGQFSTRIGRGDRIGIIGPNGAGKSTLLKILIGQLTPDSGGVKLGSNLQIATLDQNRALLKETETVQDALADGNDYVDVLGEKRHVASYAKDFLFTPDQLRAPVRVLSGGERNRLLLARILAKPSNLLILDEPTNDLDMDTLDLLEDVLSDYDGTLVLVSHDRDFLDRIVTSTIVLEGDGTAIEYAGGYSDYVSQRGVRDSKPEKTVTKATTPAAEKTSTKLSYKHKRRLELLPDEMAKTEKDITRHEAALADPGFYGRDPNGFAKANTALEQARTKLMELEEEWLEIETLREELEGN